jgi:hypothetical protein
MKIIKINSLLLLLLIFSCSMPGDEDCPEGYQPILGCNTKIPKTGKVKILISTNELNPSVPITIFYGDYEIDNIFFRDTLTANRTYNLKNKAYSVRAEYRAFFEGDTVTVYSVDGDNLTYHEDEYCDGSCYEAGEINLDAERDLSLLGGN